MKFARKRGKRGSDEVMVHSLLESLEGRVGKNGLWNVVPAMGEVRNK